MAPDPRKNKKEPDDIKRNSWHTSLVSTTLEDPKYCCFALWCAPFASYELRKRALRDDMSSYQCCAGYGFCSGKCGESRCPRCCLCLEVCCCFEDSVAYTRRLLQDEFKIKMTCCDNCISCSHCCFMRLKCIGCMLISCMDDQDTQEDSFTCDRCMISCLVNKLYCPVCACMQTQHKIELDKRNGELMGPMKSPPTQEMSQFDRPTKSSTG